MLIRSLLLLAALGLNAGAQDLSTFSASNRPISDSELTAGIDRGIEFLLADQNKDGSWGSPRQTKGLNIYAPAPAAHDAFRCGVTALCVSALAESLTAETDEKVRDSLVQGEEYLLAELPKVRRATGDALYNVWAHGYGIQALVRMYRRAEKEDDADRCQKISTVIDGQIYRLGRYESVDGGWGYYDFRYQTARPSSSSISFTTATILVAFKEVETIEGIDVPDAMVERAVASIKRQQKNDNSYAYGEYIKLAPMKGDQPAQWKFGA